VLQVTLNPSPTGTRFAFLREPTGEDELGCVDQGAFGATALVGRLLAPAPGGTQPAAAGLSLADRDRLLAALHADCFGDTITSAARCRACERTYEIGFSLRDLMTDLDARISRPPQLREGPDEHGVHTLQDGTRFRLPTVEDERTVAGLPADEAVATLLGRCVLEGKPGGARAAVEAALEALAPLVGRELPASCPECGVEQTVDFDIVAFFSAALARETPMLLREVHCLARAYGWSYAEIVGLTRSRRRALVALLLGEQEARRHTP
jgi:hypothetical protein